MASKITSIKKIVVNDWTQCNDSSDGDTTIENISKTDIIFALGDDEPNIGKNGHMLVGIKENVSNRKIAIPGGDVVWCMSTSDTLPAFLAITK